MPIIPGLRHGIRLREIGVGAWYVLVFLQPFNQFGALRLTSLFLLLCCLIGEWRLNRPQTDALAVKIGGVILCWALLVSVAGPYPADSLNALRKDFLPQIAMLLAAVRYIRSANDAWRVIGVALAGFANVTALSAVEIATFWLQHDFSWVITRNHGSFWGGYASTAGFYIPLLAGWLLTAPKPRAGTAVGGITLLLAIPLLLLYGSRTPLVVITLSVLVLLLLLHNRRALVASGLVIGCVFVLLQAMPAAQTERYHSLLQGKTYVTNSGLSLRLSVWEGCWQVIRERPLTGYGFGWKKLAWVINDGGFAERWQAVDNGIKAYFLQDSGKASYGKVNPHNYPLQVMFEIGIVGLLLVLAFWADIGRNAQRLMCSRDAALRRLAICLSTALFGYAISNMTNGYWIGGLANLSLVFAGALLSLAATGTRTGADAGTPPPSA